MHTSGQAIYSSDILYILTIYLAKVSLLYLLKRLTSGAKHQYYNFVLNIILACWTCATILVIAFQCDLQHPWSGSKKDCISMVRSLSQVLAPTKQSEVDIGSFLGRRWIFGYPQ